ncbi:hypothetical protein LTR94_038483, partial [Friedmanniomyces endolithicus]
RCPGASGPPSRAGRGAAPPTQRDAGKPRHRGDWRAASGRARAGPGAEDGDDRQTDRRRRARLQQSASGR